MALHIGIGNFSGAIASNIYRTQDEPRFILGREFNPPPSAQHVLLTMEFSILLRWIGTYVCRDRVYHHPIGDYSIPTY